jgi:4-hydroxyphenylpyruvate dioxygenase
VLKQDKVRNAYNTLTQDSPIHEHLRKHGWMKVAALWVEDATSAYEET